MAQLDELLAIERGFWTGGEAHFAAYTDACCALIFAQMQGVKSCAEVAATAGGARWQDVEIEDGFLHQPTPDVAILGYRVSASREGQPYRSLVGSTYVRRPDGWKLTAHQHSKLEQ